MLEDVKETDEEWESPKKLSAVEAGSTSEEKQDQTESGLTYLVYFNDHNE